MTQLFNIHTKEQQAQSLADFLPGGKLFDAKNIDGTNFRDLLNGLAIEFQRCEQYMADISSESDIRITQNFIDEWERAVGIPDSCFDGTGSIEQRRIDVLVKLLAPGINTRQDFIHLASLLGYTITIEYLPEVAFYPPYNIPLDLIYGIPESRYIWVVVGDGVVANIPPYDIPLDLSSSEATTLQCIFNKLKPAHTKIIFRNP